MGQEPKGAKKKEMFRAEKRRLKTAAKLEGDKKRKEKWEKEHGYENRSTARKHDPTSFRSKPSYFSNEKKTDAPNTERPSVRSRPLRIVPREGAIGFKPPVFRKRIDTDLENKGEQDPSAKRSYPKTYITSNSDRYFKGDLAGSKVLADQNSTLDGMPLNKYIAHSGACGRREAAELVKQGLVKVNNEIVYEPGHRVLKKDKVFLKDKPVTLTKHLVYILLNKPKDCITTSFDPQGRSTVLDIVKEATQERVYPVGRLDRNTTGALLLTNDGELAQKLTHPSYQIKKAYTARLDKPLTKADFDTILKGLDLEDGQIVPDVLEYLDLADKTRVGIELHSGKNHIVKRIFEHLGYQVRTLDRILFANLIKRKMQRGSWRFLTENEVRNLKFLNNGFLKKSNMPNTDESKDLSQLDYID